MDERRGWLPEGKRAAVCFTIDDVHPAKSTDRYEAGGDLGHGVLRHVEWLLARHEQLHVTLFVTPDWREICPVPQLRVLTKVPYVRTHSYLGGRWPKGRMRLDRHPGFVEYVTSLPRTDVALHGLHHLHPGQMPPIEFQHQDVQTCMDMLAQAMTIFHGARMPLAPGFTPPGYRAPQPLVEALIQSGFRFLASARDIHTSIGANATADMSGMTGVSLIYPQYLAGDALVHLPTNFQATSSLERAVQIINEGGVLSIKAHAVKDACGYVAKDGLDELYRNYLDILFVLLEQRYGESLWWTSMAHISNAYQASRKGSSESDHSI